MQNSQENSIYMHFDLPNFRYMLLISQLGDSVVM